MIVKLHAGPQHGKVFNLPDDDRELIVDGLARKSFAGLFIDHSESITPLPIRRGRYYRTEVIDTKGRTVFEWEGWLS